MATVTYGKQPGIHKTRGTVPLAGTSHLYTVSGILWPKDVEAWIAERIIPPALHICCGKSLLGDVRLDLFEQNVDVRADAARLPFPADSFATTIIDPPYNGVFQWNHDMLNELHRVASRRIIFQHWFSPANSWGQFKKAHVFELTEAAICPVLPDSASIVPAFFDENGKFYVVKEDETDQKVFDLGELTFWQPRTYFGRVQLISVFTKNDETSSETK